MPYIFYQLEAPGRARTRYHLLMLPFPQHLPGYLGVTALCLSDFVSLHQRAGYSLQELFHLTRSQVSQQRALALHVLSQIISRVSGLLAWSYLASSTHPSPLELKLFFFLLWVILGMGQMQGHGLAKVLYNLCIFNRVLSL